MAIDCSNPPCYPDFPISSIVSVFGTTPSVTNTDCSTNLLYLVDEAGLIDQSDATSEELLSTTDRTIQLSSASQVDQYFDPCSRLFWELKKFFSWNVGDLQRPKTITLGYFDSDSETMLDALQDIYKCNKCFNIVSHVTYDKNGDPLYDTTESVDLAEWTTLNGTKFSVIPTVDYVTTATQLKENAYGLSASVPLNDICVYELDENCEATDVEIDTYDITHLGLAAVLASKSDTSPNYAFTAKFTPKNNAFENLATTQEDDINVIREMTGVDPFAGGINPLAEYHTNPYLSVEGNGQYWEGLTSTGRYIDEIIHRIYIKKKIEHDIFDLFNTSQSVAISDLARLQSTLVSTVSGLVSQGLISSQANSINVDDVLEKTGLTQDNVFLQGDGYVILQYATTPANVNSRISPTFIICYVRNGSIHFSSIGLCQSEITEV